MSNAMRWKKVDLVWADDAIVSEAFSVEPYAIFFGALFPDMVAGNVGLELTIDGGTNYYPVLDPADGADAVLVASGSDPGWIDFSDWIRFFGHNIPVGEPNTNLKARFTCVAQTGGPLTITVMMRG